MLPDESLIAADHLLFMASFSQRPKNAIHKRGVQNACGLGQTFLDHPSSALPRYVSQHGRANEERINMLAYVTFATTSIKKSSSFGFGH